MGSDPFAQCPFSAVLPPERHKQSRFLEYVPDNWGRSLQVERPVPIVPLPEAVEFAFSVATSLLFSEIYPFNPVVYSLDYAVLMCDPTTAAGLPYSSTPYHYTSKRLFFSHPEFVKSEVDAMFRYYEHDDPSGLVAYPVVARDVMKPELHASKFYPRFISVPPTSHLLLINMLFGSMRDHFMSLRPLNPIVVGINPFSIEWTHLANRHFRDGYDTYGGDIAGCEFHVFDLSTQFLSRLTSHYYGCESRARDSLLYALTHMAHAFGGTLYATTDSHPSGHGLTTILTSHHVFLLYFISLYMVYFDHHVSPPPPRAIMDEHPISLYGDDSIQSHRRSSFVNFDRIAHWFTLLGSPLGPEDKAMRGVVGYIPPPSSIRFLKRAFVRCEDVYLAPLEAESISNSVSWYLPKSPMSAYSSRCISAIDEAALHDRDFYDRIVSVSIANHRAFRVSFSIDWDVYIPLSYDDARARAVQRARSPPGSFSELLGF
jgi:hypothetical protein